MKKNVKMKEYAQEEKIIKRKGEDEEI